MSQQTRAALLTFAPLAAWVVGIIVVVLALVSNGYAIAEVREANRHVMRAQEELMRAQEERADQACESSREIRQVVTDLVKGLTSGEALDPSEYRDPELRRAIRRSQAASDRRVERALEGLSQPPQTCQGVTS